MRSQTGSDVPPGRCSVCARLQAFDDLAAGESLELLDRAPDPDRAARLPRLTIAAVLCRAGRRDLESRATAIQQIL